ncbi:MAG: sensor domain-containing diguanylate cyclase [Candidatus Wallbacteria bacterium]|nr:sensor domain-containing diguanylate cyclase [Candidatus Wallbacteria bacterium]
MNKTNTFETNQELYGMAGLSISDDDRLRELNEKLNLLFKIGQKIGEFTNLSELFQKLLDSVCEVLNTEFGSIMLWNSKRRSLKIVAARGLSERVVADTEIHEGEGIAGMVFEKKTPLWVPNIQSDPYFQQYMKSGRENLTQSFLSAPIIFKDEALGVINLNNKKNGDFDREDLNLLTFLASQLAIVIKNTYMLEDSRSKAAENKVLFRLSEALNSSLDFEKNITRFFKLLARNLKLEEVGIALFHKDKKNYKFEFGYRMNSQLFQIFLKRIFLSDSQNYFFNVDDQADNKKYLYFQPLKYEDEILGIFVFTKYYHDNFTTFYDLSFIRALANQISVILKKEELTRKGKEDSSYLKQVNGFIKTISLNSFNLNTIVSEMIKILHRLYSVEGIGIYLGQEANSISIYSNTGQHDQISQLMRDKYLSANFPKDSYENSALQSYGPENTVQKSGLFLFEYALPLLVKTQKLGLVMVLGKKERFFSEKQQRQFFLITNHFAVAFENYCLFRMNERLAFTDPITEIFNYRFFFTSLKKEFSRSHRYNQPLSLIILDIDHFKHFNDQFGHQQGDLILKHLGKILNDRVRRQLDTAARYGGEEFVIIVPSTDKSGAVELAERIRQGIESYQFPSLKRKFKTHQVTVSLGITTFSGNNFQEPEEMISLADKALYVAKGSGRNRAVFMDTQS